MKPRSSTQIVIFQQGWHGQQMRCINTFSQTLKELGRPTLYSLSPGANATPIMAMGVSPLVNMYRVTGDDWDNWVHLANHFDVARYISVHHLYENLRNVPHYQCRILVLLKFLT